jgi:hypothetical protein
MTPRRGTMARAIIRFLWKKKKAADELYRNWAREYTLGARAAARIIYQEALHAARAWEPPVPKPRVSDCCGESVWKLSANGGPYVDHCNACGRPCGVKP